MILINDEKVCPHCGGYGNGEVCQNCGSFVDKWVSSHSFGNKKEIVSRYSKDTCVNKVKNKEIYFCCINDLKGYIPDDEVEQIHREFAKNFNIIGVVRDYASRGSKSPTKCKVYYPRDTSFRRNTIVHLLDGNGSIVDEFTINRGLNNVLKTFDLEEKEVSK